MFVLVALGVGMAAVNTGNNLLYLVLGLMLSLLLVSGVLSDLVLFGVRVERLHPGRLFARRRASIEIAIENQKRLFPSLSIEAADVLDGDGAHAPAYFLRVSPGARETRVVEIVPRRRGMLRLSAVALRTRYPFGLIEKWRELPLVDDLLVYPEPVAVGSVAVERHRDGEERPSRTAGSGAEIAGVRAYRELDEARDIHWRKSASSGVLVVREREREARAVITLLLDNRRPPGPSESWSAEFERAVAEAASLATLAHSRSFGVEVVTAGGASPRIATGQPLDPLLRYLALLESVDAPAPAPLARGNSHPSKREREGASP